MVRLHEDPDFRPTPDVELSIVSTVYNDAGVLPRLVTELIGQVTSIGLTYEIILVNDNSLDGTEEAMHEACKQHQSVKGISLSRNYGQQIAISAGLRYTSGKYVILIDGDLENPISSIPQLYAKAKEGFDVVYAIARRRQSFLKRVTSEFFWLVISRFLNLPMIKNQLMLRIMSRRAADSYNGYGEISRSVAGITYDIGYKFTEIIVEPNKRVSGRSNYTFAKRLNIFIDIVLNLSLKPLSFLIFLGFFTFIGSGLIAMYYLYIYFSVGTVPGYTSVILSIFFFGSIIVFSLGIMARYLSLIYLEVRRRPLFLVRQKFKL